MSLAEQKRKHLKSPRLRENYRVQIKAVAVERNSGTPHNGSVKRKAVTWKKKRKTRRSRQISLLDEQGKEDLQKRCKTILDNLTDG